MKPILFTLLTLAAFSSAAHAALVIADFNDNTLGQLSNFTAGNGQAGGTGFDPAANNTWSNTGTINAIAGDLAPPISTNYNIPQGGAAPVSAQGTFADGRQTTRALDFTLTGDVWFSFLRNQPTANSRGGITFNQNGSSPGDPRIVATGADVRIGIATIQPPGGGANGVITIGTSALVLGRLSIDPLGDEVLDVWIDPDVAGGIGGLGAPSTSLTQQSASLDAGITRLGLQSYSSDNQGGIVDAVRVSDDSNANQAFADVTGVLVPEPSTAFLMLFGALAALRRRR